MARSKVLILLLSVLFVATHARRYVVTSTDRLPDTNPGDGICRNSLGRCSLRAAVEEANAGPQTDEIVIPSGTYPTDVGTSGLSIRESVKIVASSNANTPPILSGNSQQRHFSIDNEKLLVGRRNGEIGAFRPSSGQRLNSVASPVSGSSFVGDILVDGDNLFAAVFIKGVARYTLRSRTAIENSNSKATYVFDRFVVNDQGNGAGLTAPTTVAKAGNGDLLVNNFQPTDFGIRRYDPNTFVFKGIFISPPGIVNTMVRFGSLLFLTLVNEDEVRTYNANTGAFVKKSTSFLNTPRGIVICAGRVLVANEQSNQILEFDQELNFIRVIVSDPGRLDTPQNLACLFPDDLFIRTKSRKLLQYKLGATSSTFVRDLTIAGTPAGGLAVISGRDRAGGPQVSIRGLTLQDGAVRSPLRGPSLLVTRGSTVRIDRCTLKENRGRVFGGAITNFGTVRIIRSRLVDNTMPPETFDGGGVTNSGGAISNSGKLIIRFSEIANNRAARGGGIFNVGAEAFLSIFSSTISNNFAGNAGGGIFNTAFVELKYSTIADNGCGQFSGDPASRRVGCGIYTLRDSSGNRDVVTISSTIIAKNMQLGNFGQFAPDCLAPESSSIRSFGTNIIGAIDPTLCQIFGSTGQDAIGNQVTPRDPGIGPLQFLTITKRNGAFTSFTRGHDPRPGGLATTFNPFGSGGNPIDKCPKKDQIGRRRPQGAICDVGAIEREV